MYLETGQGSALSAGAHLGTGGRPVDQQTLETRAYAVARDLEPLLVNTVVGFIGPEYLYDGKQIIRAGLEDHFCGKLLGLPMGVDVCYTNHAEADQDDMDTLLTLLGAAGAAFVIAVPGADDVMLGYQSLSFHDVLYVRQVLGLRPAPEFESWMQNLGMADSTGRVLPMDAGASPLRQLTNGQLTNGNRPGLGDQLAVPGDRSGQRRSDVVVGDFWDVLRLTTQSRIGLGRSGDSLPTRRVLEFSAAHASARDAVHEPLDTAAFAKQVTSVGIGDPVVVTQPGVVAGRVSAPTGPGTGPARPVRDHLQQRRPGNRAGGRALAPCAGRPRGGPADRAGRPARRSLLDRAPVIATQARVALGDHIAQAMGVRTVLVVIGERPGLSVADSLGIYLTHAPRPGRTDADRNCISNIHPPDGLSYDQAALVAAGLIAGARTLGKSGVALKDTSRAPLGAGSAAVALE